MTIGTRVTITAAEGGYETFIGRTGTITKIFTAPLGANSIPTERVVIEVDNYPWGFQTLACNVQPH